MLLHQDDRPCLAEGPLDEARSQGGDGGVPIFCDDHALAGGKPVGLDHVRRRQLVQVLDGLVHIGERPGGIPYLWHSSFAHAFDPSILAAALVGPNARCPSASNSSTRPFTSGVSGPTTVRSMDSRWTSSKMLRTSSGSTGTQVASTAIPGLPGAANIRSTVGFWARRHTTACSRPPPPTTRILMRQSRDRRGCHLRSR